MFLHYLKFFIRDIIRNKLYAFINLAGLIIGLALTFLLLLYVVHEVYFDKSNNKYERIYRVTCHESNLDWFKSNTPYPLGAKLKKQFPEIEESATIISQIDPEIKIGEEFVLVQNFYFVDKDLLNIISLPLVSSSGNNPLESPESVIINKQWADKIFGKTNPIGRNIEIRIGKKEYNLKVTAIMDDLPLNLSLRPNILANIEIGLANFERVVNYSDTLKRDANYYKTSYDEWWFTTFILLNKGADFKTLENKIDKIKLEFQPKEHWKYELLLQPMSDFHFSKRDYVDDFFEEGKLTNIMIYSGVGLLILIIAISNYLILSLARSTSRLKEYGVRKIVGGSGLNLSIQTIRESMLFSFIAFPLALTLAEILLPSVNRIFNLQMEIRYSQNIPFILGMLAITIFTGLISSVYLAYIASRSNPIEIFKTGFSNRLKRSTLMKVLIVLQLVIFIALLSSTLIINGQISYARNKSLGFNKENLISIKLVTDEQKNFYNTFKDILSSNPDIIGVTGSMWEIPNNFKMGVTNSLKGKPETQVKAEGLFVDYDFTEVLQIPIVQGQPFDQTMNMDEYPIIVNKALVDMMQLKDPVGTKLSWGKIVGVTDNFQMHSVHNAVQPLLLFYNTESVRTAIVRIKPGKIVDVVDFVKKKWSEIASSTPTRIVFFDSNLEQLYNEEKRFRTIVLLFTITSIFIAGLGLFGLAIFITKRRTKEIGVRRVLGAKNSSIIKLILGEFVLLVLFAGIISIPITLWFMNKWLLNYAYHSPIKPIHFVISILIATLIVTLTLLVQTLKAAKVNPVESLRYE